MSNNEEQKNTQPDEIEKAHEPSELDVCRKERDEYLDMARRLKAEFMNYKKDEEKRFLKTKSLSNLRMVLELITVLDGFNTAAEAVQEKKGEAWVDGILQIKRQLEDVLMKEGVKKIEIVRGAEFDPEFHEGLLMEDSDLGDGVILEEIRPGYTLHGAVIRPSQVKISKGKQT